VDDNAGARGEKTRTLRGAGFTVVECANGSGALQLVRERLPDLVLLDMKLPDMSGLEVCRQIKQNPETAAVLVLQTSTSLTDSSDRVRGLDLGADNFMVGPVEPLVLIANVNALLRLREVQRALFENEERFRQMAENIADVVWIFDPHTLKLLYVSPAYEKIWGRTSARLYENFYAWQESIHPDDRSRVRAAFNDLLIFREYEQEYRLLMPDGSQRWIRDRGFPVRDGAGNNYRVTRISQDISAPKLAELALNDANLRKDEFLATLAHELRNPLAPMRTAIDLMRLEEEVLKLPSSAIDARGIISRQINNLVRLVDDLLDVSRITQGKLLLKKRAVELQPIIDSALETNAAYIGDRGHQLTVTVTERVIFLDADSMRLAQALGNLLHNAAKYTPIGGQISLTTAATDGLLRIQVADDGIGIARDNIDHIFELFTHAQRLDSKAQEGLGVGLSLVKHVIELHDGRIAVESPGPGCGTTFTIELPIAPGLDEEKPKRQPRKKMSNKKSLRILLVDDSVDAVSLMRVLLQSMGHDVAVANDGGTALALSPGFIPHVIILDIGLPGMDGYKVAQELLKIPSLQQTTLVALTGYGQEKDREKAFSTGFHHHFIKPVEIDDLTNLLNTIEVF
jgi:PAS domain S-box-containing protein